MSARDHLDHERLPMAFWTASLPYLGGGEIDAIAYDTHGCVSLPLPAIPNILLPLPAKLTL